MGSTKQDGAIQKEKTRLKDNASRTNIRESLVGITSLKDSS